MEGAARRTSKRRIASLSNVDEDNSSNESQSKKMHSVGGDGSTTSNGKRDSPSEFLMSGAGENPMEYLKNLPPLPRATPPLRKLTKAEIEELETVLEFRAPDAEDHWRDDWSGNLSFAEKDILNPALKAAPGKKSFRQPLVLWAVNSPSNIRLLRNLLHHVCSTPNVPQAVKKILGGINDDTPAEGLIRTIRRASYDPQVLKQDGWTTVKSNEPHGATGGPFLIGDKILCDGAHAVVIAYVHDSDIGDLWKALWIDDLISFDLEAEELLDAKRKWERRHNQSAVDASKSRRSSRFSVSSDFTVKGIEYGIVLGASYSKGARPGVYWPARVMHASEGGGDQGQGRRSSSKQKVDLVFLAPYWSPDEQSGRSRRVESLSASGESIFKANPLLQVETIEASDEMLKEYPYSSSSELDIAQLQMSFRFTGLPKSAFTRYLDAHRLAMALREYAMRHLKAQFTATDRASAGLFETHPMSVQAPSFPSVILHLPFAFILSQLPRTLGERPLGSTQDAQANIEPVLKLNNMVNAMKPPCCWGDGADNSVAMTPVSKQKPGDESSPSVWLKGTADDEIGEDHSTAIESFMTDYPLLNENFNRYCSSPPLVGVLSSMTRLLAQLAEEEEENLGQLSMHERRSKLKALVTSWTIVKRLGEESLASLLRENAGPVLVEWRRAAERIYKYMVAMFSDAKKVGNGFSVVITDSRCNEHRTSSGCFERPVRLPAALKGAKLAGVGKDETTRLITSVPDHYVEFVEHNLLAKAHSSSYLKQMKSRCAAARTDDEVLFLTDNSDGEGGEDTSKSYCFEMCPLCFTRSNASFTKRRLARNVDGSCDRYCCSYCRG
jgi:hypothetical protein